MAKYVKIAGLAIGAAALIATGVGAIGMAGLAGTMTVAGVSTSTLFLTSSGLAMAAGMLQKTPEVPKAQTERLTASVDPRAFRKAPMGQTAFPVDVRYEEWSGNDQDYCDWIVCVASCAVESAADEIWLNQELAWTRAGGVQGKFKNYLSVPNIINEGTPANAFTFGSGKWNASRRLTGCAYLRLRFKVTGNGKKGESPFASGIPSRITIVGRGSKLYDPRRDSTVPGGSGPMRADDQSTWRYVTDDGATIGENLPLHALRDLLGWRIQNPATGEWKLAVGCGIPKKRIDLRSFIVAANIADEPATRSSGGTEPKYHGACVLSESEDPRSRQDTLLAACNGKLQDANGKLAIKIAHNDLAAAALDEGLGDDDVVGPFTWDPDPSLEQTPNVVRGKFIDPSPASLFQPIDYPEVRIPSLDGIDRAMAMDLGAVESGSHAQRIVKQALQRKQYNRHFAAPFDITAWRYNIGDVVPFTFAPLGFKRKLFRVVEMDPRSNPCPVVLREENAAIYQWDADDRAPVQAAVPTAYDWAKNPLILAIGDAGKSADWSGINDDDGKKPADGATNSADPTSPMGPGKTVGGVIDEIAQAAEKARLAAEAARLLDAAVDATNEDVADVQASLATARSEVAAVRTDASKALTDLSAEVVRAKDAEGTLTTKVETAQRAADGNATAISTETTQRATDVSGLAARTFTLETSYTRGGIGVDTPDRAAFSATASGAPEGLANTAQATTTNATIGLSWVLTVAQGGPLYHKAVAPVRPGRTWKQEVTAIRAAAGTAANMRTVTVILDASYAVLATINGSSTGVLATPTTLTNTQVCDTILANYPTAAFIRFGFGRSANANSHVSRSVVTDATEALAVRALIASEEAARTTNDSAIALRVDSIDTTVQGNTTAIRDETVARSDGDGALGRRIDSVVAQATTDRGDYTAKVENEVAARSGGDSALAGRTSAVEAQLAGTQSSGLLAKIGDETIARVDGVSAVAARTATLETGFSRVPQTWMVKAKGASATTPSGFGDAGVFAPDGTRYGIASRSYTVVVFTAGANTVETTRAFDVYANGSTNGPVAMATFLNGLAAGKTVIIYTADEPRNARLTDVLVAAMRRCGAGERYESSDFRDRSAYILIGRVGVGRGGGIEYYAGSVDNDTAAWLEVPFTLVSGRAEVGSQGGISSTATRLAEETVSRSTGDSALASRTGAVEATVNTGPNSNASLRGAVNDVATASANGLSALAQRTGGVEARAGSLESRTGIVETAVADSKNKLAAARLEISATSPGGRVSMAFKSDTYSGASIDIEGDATWKGKIDVRSVTSTGSLLMSNQAVKVFDATRIRVQLGNLDV